ncbi:Uncharacterised protein [Pluralibacter gergoviae]|nr:Uncharacterised protein [Pluralibacter gergoviae]
MNNVLITGASGLVGDHLLRMLIQQPDVLRIAAPGRRPLAGVGDKVQNPCDPQLTDALAQVAGADRYGVLLPRHHPARGGQ